MSKALFVHLSSCDREHLESLVKKGVCSARVQTRARILLLADRACGQARTQAQVAEAVLCCAMTVGQVCRRFALQGMDAALSEKPRPGKAPKITGAVEAHLVALACSAPPEGASHWTLSLLKERLILDGHLDSISTVAVHKRLKKTR